MVFTPCGGVQNAFNERRTIWGLLKNAGNQCSLSKRRALFPPNNFHHIIGAMIVDRRRSGKGAREGGIGNEWEITTPLAQRVGKS